MRKVLYVLVSLLLLSSYAHADFITSDTALPSNKTNLSPIPVGADPTKYFQASDANSIFGALTALRTAVTTGAYLGLASQASDPTARTFYPTSNYFWYKSDGTLHFYNGTDNTVPFGTGGGITGLTAGTIPIATASTTIGNSPIKYDASGTTTLDVTTRGSTSGIGGLNIQPQTQSSNYGAMLSLDNTTAEVGGSQWSLLAFNANTSFDKQFGICSGATTCEIIVYTNNHVLINHNAGDEGHALTVGGDIQAFGAGNGIIFGDGSHQTTAATPGYSPAVPSNWASTAPTTIASALDRIAAMAASGTLAKP